MEYKVTQLEYNYQQFLPETQKLEIQKWDVKRFLYYTNGIVLGKFQENDALTMQVLKEGVTNQAYIVKSK